MTGAPLVEGATVTGEVVEQGLKLKKIGNDIVNVVGGLRIGETAVDLPTVLAIVSSFRDRALDEKLVSFGELGLAGEVRPVRFGTERIQAAAKQGFTRCIVPHANRPRTPVDGIEVQGVRRLREALELLF